MSMRARQRCPQEGYVANHIVGRGEACKPEPVWTTLAYGRVKGEKGTQINARRDEANERTRDVDSLMLKT